MSNPSPWWGSGSKGDIAAGAIGYATGFAVDVFLFPLGVPPGTTAGVFAVGAVGLKNAVQAWRSSRLPTVKRTPETLEEAANTFINFIEQEHKKSSGAKSNALADLLQSFQKDVGLWRVRIRNDEEFALALDEHVERFRKI